MEMGTGKTLTTIGITGALSNAGRIRRVLVVAPLSILGVWEEEFQKFADFPYCLVVLSGNGSRKRDTLRHMAGAALQVAVVNYESAWRMEKDLGAWRPDLIVADEGHKIKTHNISASRAMHRLGAKAGYRLLLMGTVITNKAVDVFSQYKFVDPAIFGQSFYAFRATKAECLDLPEMTDILRQVELGPAALQIHRGLVKESYAELSGGEVTATNILTRLLRACLKTHSRHLQAPICGRYVPYKGGVAGYGNRIWGRYTAKWGIQIAGMGFQTPSRGTF